MTDSKKSGRVRLTIIALLAVGSVAGGVFSVFIPEASAAPDFYFKVGDISVHRFQDGPRTCYVSSTGALACVK